MKRCPLRDFVNLTSAPAGGADLLAAFIADPPAVATAYDLSDPQRDAVLAALTGDSSALQTELQNEGCKGKIKWSPVGLLTI